MESDENMPPRGPASRPPSRIPASAGRELQELSAAEDNARSAMSMPPPTTAVKHKPSNLPEPSSKRRTLKDMAGEISHQANGAQNLRSRSVISRDTSWSHGYDVLASSLPSAASRSFTHPSRTPATFSQNPNTARGAKQSSTTALSRPQSALSNTGRGGLGRAVANSRPASTLDQHPIHGRPEANAWDTKSRFEDFEKLTRDLKEQMESSTAERGVFKEYLSMYKSRVDELASVNTELTSKHGVIQNELELAKEQLTQAKLEIEDAQRAHRIEIDDLQRQHRSDSEESALQCRREVDNVRAEERENAQRITRDHQAELDACDRKWRLEVEDERSRRSRDVSDIQTQWTLQRQHAELDATTKDREAQNLKIELSSVQTQLEQQQGLNSELKEKLVSRDASIAALEAQVLDVNTRVNFLQSDSQAQSQAFEDLHHRMQEAIASATEANEKLRQEETLRRKLHNQVQELKGNIRVFCRVRPSLDPSEEDLAKIGFPDQGEECKELLVAGPEQKSAIGTVTTQKHQFSFDRVFNHDSKNAEIFEEISQLVQSALDGYNVCIFAYGQTGSGKTYTMSTSVNGMIPLAVNQIWSTVQTLEEKGWSYSMHGSFIEVYNENLNDLLGKADDLDKKKHEIRHDNVKCRTEVTGVEVVSLDSPATVEQLLDRAAKNRSVAATKANERSSRSHSVFILRISGTNSITGEECEGTLNLVDLAGSERIKESGVEGQRLRETQNINKSLSSLGDVISALGQGKKGEGHVPYRNSKLTYLLQHSLGGNSKTLMLVMISPLMHHLQETLTSLKFATKVHNTHVGTAKRQAKVA